MASHLDKTKYALRCIEREVDYVTEDLGDDDLDSALKHLHTMATLVSDAQTRVLVLMARKPVPVPQEV